MPRRLRTILILLAPSLVALTVLALANQANAVAAVFAAVACFVALLVLVPTVLPDTNAIESYWLARIGGADSARPRFANAATSDLSELIERLDAAWSDRLSERLGTLELLDHVLDAIPEALLVLDSRRRVVRANAAARDLLGADILHADLAMSLRHPAVLSAADAVLAGDEARDIEVAFPESVERHMAGHIVPLTGARSESGAAVIALYDMTAIRRAERLRADFVANASHELRTPLSALLGFVETLRGPAQDDAEARQRFLPIMHQQASRMARLVDDLLSLSRIEMNEHTAPAGRTDLRGTVQGAIDSLEFEARSKGVTIAADIPDSLASVIGDEHELAQVCQNLLDNALKYGRDEAPVRINAAPATLDGGDAVALSVSDEGEGIPPEHVPRLTERFYRVDTARSRTLGGTGLGLAIVKHIVNRHRGRLAIESVIGQGSTFTVCLALAPPEESDERAPAERIDPAPNGTTGRAL